MKKTLMFILLALSLSSTVSAETPKQQLNKTLKLNAKYHLLTDKLLIAQERFNTTKSTKSFNKLKKRTADLDAFHELQDNVCKLESPNEVFGKDRLGYVGCITAPPAPPQVQTQVTTTPVPPVAATQPEPVQQSPTERHAAAPDVVAPTPAK